MSITIEAAVQKIDAWQGKAVQIKPLSGGLTNTNYRVEVDGTPHFVRIPGAKTDLLAIDRANEYHNTRAAAEAGVGARVLYHIPEDSVMVLEFIQGKTMSIQSLNEAGMPTRIAQSLKKLHAGPRFYSDFNMFRLTEFYLDICRQHEVKIPDGFTDHMPTVQQIERTMLVKPLATVPCNNDLLAENYMDDGAQLRLIDFEYSGNNDPTFELGNTCQELQYDEENIVELCSAYFGQATPARLSRMKLNMIMSDVGWTLWAAIQAKISTIDFDFWGWAEERWGRAVAKMDSPEYSGWMQDVQKPN
jgi:thiamine kinase-like enzyme